MTQHTHNSARPQMPELGIDIAGQEPKTLDRYRCERFDAVITV
jgi:protein-tyrosine-phosphatase